MRGVETQRKLTPHKIKYEGKKIDKKLPLTMHACMHRKLYILGEEGKTIMKRKSEKLTDLYGCIWEIQEGIWVCVKRCSKHSKPKSKRPYRPKAESVRSGGKFD